MNLERQPTWRDIFTLFLFVAPPGYAIIYAILSYNYLSNSNPHALFALTQYSKAAFAILIACYSVIVGYLIIQKHKKFALHANIFLTILLLSPIIMEFPYFLLDFYLGIPSPTPMEKKEILTKLPFTVPVSIVFFVQLYDMTYKDSKINT